MKTKDKIKTEEIFKGMFGNTKESNKDEGNLLGKKDEEPEEFLELELPIETPKEDEEDEKVPELEELPEIEVNEMPSEQIKPTKKVAGLHAQNKKSEEESLMEISEHAESAGKSYLLLLLTLALCMIFAVVAMFLYCKKNAPKKDNPSLSSQEGKSKTYSELATVTSME